MWLSCDWRSAGEAKLLSNRARLFRPLNKILLVCHREAYALMPASWVRGDIDRSHWQHVLIRQDSFMGSFGASIVVLCFAKMATLEGKKVDH